MKMIKDIFIKSKKEINLIENENLNKIFKLHTEKNRLF